MVRSTDAHLTSTFATHISTLVPDHLSGFIQGKPRKGKAISPSTAKSSYSTITCSTYPPNKQSLHGSLYSMVKANQGAKHLINGSSTIAKVVFLFSFVNLGPKSATISHSFIHPKCCFTDPLCQTQSTIQSWMKPCFLPSGIWPLSITNNETKKWSHTCIILIKIGLNPWDSYIDTASIVQKKKKGVAYRRHNIFFASN